MQRVGPASVPAAMPERSHQSRAMSSIAMNGGQVQAPGIRLLGPADAADYQRLRLAGLRGDAPAFGSSYEEECDRPLSAVAERLSRDPGQTFVLGAFCDGALAGVVGFYRETSR